MELSDMKYVVAAQEGKPAIIRFFDSVNEYSTRCFNEEFLWVQDIIKPSKIIVLINSEGGSILHGMSTFSVIQGCPIEVDCVVEGIAASMASVIWAAGDNLYMHDYSIVMIHNPFVCKCDDGCDKCKDESEENMINAFRTQLETIYQKRFGLSKDEVRSIMDGEGNADGTFFNAKDAVERGLVKKENIIKTSKQTRDKVKNELGNIALDDKVSLRLAMAKISGEIDQNKLIEKIDSIHNQTEEEIQVKQNQKVMEKDILSFGAVAAQLGFPAETEVANVSARVAELLAAEASLKDAQAKVTEFESVKAELDNVKIQLAGKEAEAANAQAELDRVQADLKVYQDAEKAAREAEIEATVEAAIKAGKIDESAKENWIAMAQTNFEMVKATLDSIQAREKISEEIAKDPDNKADAEASLKDAEQKMQEQVEKVVGKVELKTF